jgi:hypothetical protein
MKKSVAPVASFKHYFLALTSLIKYTVIVNNVINYERLSYLIQYYDDALNGIPESSGIYYWVYWPDFEYSSISTQDLTDKLLEFTTRSLFFKEVIRGPYKFEAEIREQTYPSNGNFFGLSHSKQNKLLAYLNLEDNKRIFHDFFKEVCFSRPFYIGKANNLRRRLVSQHFKGKTEVLPEIDGLSINYSDIWVGFKIIDDPNDEGLNNIFEEILSRKIKPGLTKKPN